MIEYRRTAGSTFPGITSRYVQGEYAPHNFEPFVQLLSTGQLGHIAVRANDGEIKTFKINDHPDHAFLETTTECRGHGPVHIIERVALFLS